MKIGEIERIGERELPVWHPREMPAPDRAPAPEPVPEKTPEEEVPA